MGWTNYHAEYYKKGKVDVKKELDEMWRTHATNDQKLLKSVLRGSVWYAALEYVADNGETKIGALIYRTSTNLRDYYNFSYKAMDETMGPGYYDYPVTMLKALTPTENEYANEWRRKCYEKLKKQKFLKDATIGTKIKVGNDIFTKTNYYGKIYWLNGNRYMSISSLALREFMEIK